MGRKEGSEVYVGIDVLGKMDSRYHEARLWQIEIEERLEVAREKLSSLFDKSEESEDRLNIVGIRTSLLMGLDFYFKAVARFGSNDRVIDAKVNIPSPVKEYYDQLIGQTELLTYLGFENEVGIIREEVIPEVRQVGEEFHANPNRLIWAEEFHEACCSVLAFPFYD